MKPKRLEFKHRHSLLAVVDQAYDLTQKRMAQAAFRYLRANGCGPTKAIVLEGAPHG